MSFQGRRDFYGIVRIDGRCVRDGNDRHYFLSLDYLARSDNRARPVLTAFFRAFLMFSCPKIRIANDETQLWLR